MNSEPIIPAGTTVEAICASHGNSPAALIEILHDLQDELGTVPSESLETIAAALNISRAEVHGVVSFYHDFRHEPAGKVVVKLCRAEACQARGALDLIDRACAAHGTALGGTGDDGVTVEPAYCLGNCALAPAAMVGDRLHGRLDAERLDRAIAEALA